MAKKTPSPTVLASQWILDQLDVADDQQLSVSDLAVKFDTRISQDKKAKIVEQIKKITKKTKERAQRVVDKFQAPAAAPE